MSKLSELLSDQSSGGDVVPDGHIKRFLAEIGAELKHQGAMGAHELAAGILGGHDAFVMYPRQDSVEQEPHHGLPVEPMRQPEMDGPSM